MARPVLLFKLCDSLCETHKNKTRKRSEKEGSRVPLLKWYHTNQTSSCALIDLCQCVKVEVGHLIVDELGRDLYYLKYYCRVLCDVIIYTTIRTTLENGLNYD